MKNKITNFWSNNKNTIKNITIAVAVPLAAMALYGVSRMNKIVDENNLNDLFYPEDDSNEEA